MILLKSNSILDYFLDVDKANFKSKRRSHFLLTQCKKKEVKISLKAYLFAIMIIINFIIILLLPINLSV